MRPYKKILLATAALSLSLSVAAQSGNNAKDASTKAAAQDLTMALIDANAHYAAAAPGDKGLRLGELIKTARDRHDALSVLIAADPAEALKVMLPASLRASFPGDAASLLEQDADEDGILAVYHVDSVDTSANRYLYLLDTGKGKLSLYFAGKPPILATGTKVRVHGFKINNLLALDSGTNSVTTVQAAALPNTLGTQKALTILVNFTDEATQPYTVAFAQSLMFTTTSNYFYEASYQQTTLTGDVAGWFTVPVSSTTCDYASISTYARQAATNAGFVLSNYHKYVYVFPANTCTWSGMSTVGGDPSESWIHTKFGFALPVLAHELGHTLGLYHAHSLSCPGGVAIATSGCITVEYGDYYDPMGGGSNLHYNAFMKEQLGWLNAGVSPPITTLSGQSGSANYTIAPTEATRNSTSRALKVPRTAACGSATDYFYIESRQALGFDTGLSTNTNMLTGVLMHEASSASPNSSALLDMAPLTTGWSGPALDAGLSFTDPVSGLTITPLSVGTSATTVNVNFPPGSCTRAAPAIALTPSGTQYTSAGATATYSVTVTNNDSCNCAASSFNITATVPTGWGATNPQIGSVAAGASGSSSLSITSPSTAAAAFYTIPSTATNASAPSFAASANATVAVVSTNTAPTIALSPTATQSSTAGATVTYTVTVTNHGSSASSFNITAAVPTGWTATHPQTASIAAGASGSTSISITSTSSAGAGIYTIPITAADSAAPGSSASANATISVLAASLNVTAASDHSSYTRPTKGNQTFYAVITTNVTNSGTSVAGAAVSVQVKDPKGGITTLLGTTGSTGTAAVTYPIKFKAVTGAYSVTSKATFATTSNTATTSFMVQ